MASLHDDVFDAALSYIANNGVEAEVQDSGNAALVDSIALDGENYGVPGDNGGAGGGRKITCLVNDTGDMQSIPVGSPGNATHVVIRDGSGNVLVDTAVADAPKALGAADLVNIGTFDVIIKDPG